jgi:hypothetical protein
MRHNRPLVAALSLAVLLPLAGKAEAGGDAAALGIFGFAAGAIVGNALAGPRVYYAPPPPPPVYYAPAPVYVAPVYAAPPAWSPDWYAYCSSVHVSFDSRSGTYVGVDGYRYFCR